MCWVMPPASSLDHVGVAQRVQELGLAVVDVTHHGDDRRAHLQVALVALVGAELEVEGLQQLAVLVLGRDDLDDVVELLAEQLEGRVVDRLGRGDHLAEVEQHLHQRGRRRRRSSRRSRSARRPARAGRSRRCPCGPGRRRSSGPPSARTPGDARAWTCGHVATGRRGDRTHPACCRAGRDDRHRGDRRTAGSATGPRSHRDRRPARRVRHDPGHRRAAGAAGATRRCAGARRDRLVRGDRACRRRDRRRPATSASSPGSGGACRAGREAPSDAPSRAAGAAGRLAHALGGGERVVARARSARTGRRRAGRGGVAARLGRCGRLLGARLRRSGLLDDRLGRRTRPGLRGRLRRGSRLRGDLDGCLGRLLGSRLGSRFGQPALRPVLRRARPPSWPAPSWQPSSLPSLPPWRSARRRTCPGSV